MSCSLNLTRFDERPIDDLHYIGFNQENSCLAVGNKSGFRIFTFRPYKEAHRREFSSGGIGIVEMLFRSNILALGGGGSKPAYEKNKVILWDDHQQQPIGELSFKTEVKCVKMRRDRIFVALVNSINVYTFEKLERSHRFDTYTNEIGMIGITPQDRCVLAFPTTKKGHVRVEFLDEKKTQVIRCHEGEISCLCLSRDGSRLATTSAKGTIIRVFDSYKGDLVKEVRRGSEKANVYSLAFNRDASMICSSSSTGTVHIFQCDKKSSEVDGRVDEEPKKGPKNRKSKLAMLGKAVPYLRSEWSFAWFKGPECPLICSFGTENDTLFVMTSEGNFYDLHFDPKKGGSCVEKKALRFIKGDD